MNPLSVLDGFKTAIVGLGLVGGGAYLVSLGQTERGLECITFGLGILGLAHKGARTERSVNAILDVLTADKAPEPPAPT